MHVSMSICELRLRHWPLAASLTLQNPNALLRLGRHGVPDPRAGIDAGSARGAGVTGAGTLRADSLGAAGGRRPFDLDHLLAVARSVGLDAERLVRDMEAPGLDALIERNAILANVLGVRGTSAFVIGDGMIRGALPQEQFRAAIAEARIAPEGARNRSGTD